MQNKLTGNSSPSGPHRVRRNRRAFTLIEVMIACSVIAIAFGGIMHAMILVNRQATLSRIQTNARCIVQRHIERALAEKFSPTSVPAILELTPTAGVPWSDDGSNSPVPVVIANGSTLAIVSGNLIRTVTRVVGSGGADIRRVTFSISYPYRGRTMAVALTTLRSRD